MGGEVGRRGGAEFQAKNIQTIKRAAERTEKLGNLRKSLVHLSDCPNNRGSEIPNSFATSSRFGAGGLVCQISSAGLFPLFWYLYTETVVEHDNDKLHSPVKIPCRCVLFFNDNQLTLTQHQLPSEAYNNETYGIQVKLVIYIQNIKIDTSKLCDQANTFIKYHVCIDIEN